MGTHPRMTEARIRRVITAARAVDPAAVIEVTAGGTIRILPASAGTLEKTRSAVDRWFDDDAH